MTEHLIFVSTATLAVGLFVAGISVKNAVDIACLLYTSPSPRD